MSVILAGNHYWKSRVRMVKVTRHPDRHDLKEVTVGIQFEGDFETSYTAGDNSKVLPTDTMKNTVYALAKENPVEQIEEFALRLIAHFLKNTPQVRQVRIEIAEHLWTRITVAGKPHNWAFTRSGNEKRIAVVTGTRSGVSVEAGIEDLVVLKTGGSGFEGYPGDRYTTLQETRDRILATAIRASWLYDGPEVAFGTCWYGVRQLLLDTFAEHDSRSVQHTLYAMGEAVLKTYEDILEIRLSLPNKHCLLVDLAPFGLENNNEIFVPVDEPHGLIEARLTRRGGSGGGSKALF